MRQTFCISRILPVMGKRISVTLCSPVSLYQIRNTISIVLFIILITGFISLRKEPSARRATKKNSEMKAPKFIIQEKGVDLVLRKMPADVPLDFALTSIY